MLCKTSVARKFLSHLHSNRIGLSRSSIYSIDAKRHFGASVEACLLFCEFTPLAQNYDYDVYESLDNPNHQRVGHRNGVTVRDLDTFERLRSLYGSSEIRWRSGVKHDCSQVMEFREVGGTYINGLGESADIESAYLFPLLKGSDVGNNRVVTTDRHVLVTQRTVGESTEPIKHSAPKTWAYLKAHANYLDERKSRIYQDNPRFSMFGIGPYTFKPYKIAICSLYKNLDFRIVVPMRGEPVIFDDTIYFVSFETLEEATRVLSILSSSLVRDFYSSLIFWDEKRPIKTSILNSLNLEQLGGSQTLRLL